MKKSILISLLRRLSCEKNDCLTLVGRSAIKLSHVLWADNIFVTYEDNIYVNFISEMTYVNILVFLVVTSDCTMYILLANRPPPAAFSSPSGGGGYISMGQTHIWDRLMFGLTN